MLFMFKVYSEVCRNERDLGKNVSVDVEPGTSFTLASAISSMEKNLNGKCAFKPCT